MMTGSSMRDRPTTAIRAPQTTDLGPSRLRMHLARPGPRVTVISVAGEVDLANDDSFAATVQNTIAASPGQRIVLDLHRVRFLAACGISTLLAAGVHAGRVGAELRLVLDDTGPVARTLRLASIPVADLGHTLIGTTPPRSPIQREEAHVGPHHPQHGPGRGDDSSRDRPRNDGHRTNRAADAQFFGQAASAEPSRISQEGLPSRPAHPGLPATPTDGQPAQTQGRAGQIAPFVAWMATQPLDETTRRCHREAIEAYLRWIDTDPGPADGRRGRYEQHLTQQQPGQLAHAQAGLNQYAAYQRLRARTLPIDHH